MYSTLLWISSIKLYLPGGREEEACRLIVYIMPIVIVMAVLRDTLHTLARAYLNFLVILYLWPILSLSAITREATPSNV